MAIEATGNGNGGLYFIVGGLVVAVAIGFFIYQGGYIGGFSSKTTTLQTITAPVPSGDGSTTTTTTKQTTTP